MTKKTTRNKPASAKPAPAANKPDSGKPAEQRPEVDPPESITNDLGEEPEEEAGAETKPPDVETRHVASAPTTADKLAIMRAKKDELELEELTYRLENERNRRSERKQQSETQQRSLADAVRQQAAIQEACPHRKGGKDMGGLTRGTDTKYSVGTVTQPWGQQYVLCSRCGKQWMGPFNGKPADPGFYEAIQWPTDNEPSGTQIFLVYPRKSPDVAGSTQELIAK